MSPRLWMEQFAPMYLERFAPSLAGAFRPCVIWGASPFGACRPVSGRSISPLRDLEHVAPWNMSPRI
eukprot:4068829-Pyramimonas_sp.AAC.1